jgi:uncharacterized protein (TIGR03905 family)
MYVYKPKGVCSKEIHVELDGDKIKSVQFIGGCHGNTQGISILAKGMDAHEYIEKCKNIKCGNKNTSCPAQLAIAVKNALDENKR